jgi:hypothetical protein
MENTWPDCFGSAQSPLNVPQHIIQRGNNRQGCFASEHGFASYISGLKEYSKKILGRYSRMGMDDPSRAFTVHCSHEQYYQFGDAIFIQVACALF